VNEDRVLLGDMIVVKTASLLTPSPEASFALQMGLAATEVALRLPNI
jgi:hypothetical protein